MTASTSDAFGRDFHGAFDQAPVAVAITTPAGVLLSVNPLLGRLLGRDHDELIGRALFAVCHPDDLASAQAACVGLNQGADRTRELECRLVHVDGRAVSVRVNTAKLLDDTGAASHLVMHIEDITAHHALTDDLLHRALHDPLTGLPNRDLLRDKLVQALARHERTGQPLTLLYLDLDHFKTINDTYGHATGDAVLAEVARRLTATLRAGDSAARFGGDEFVMICENTDRHQAIHIAARITADLAAPHHINSHGAVATVPVSVGSATTTHESRSAAELMHAADVAMYQAKHHHSDGGVRP